MPAGAGHQQQPGVAEAREPDLEDGTDLLGYVRALEREVGHATQKNELTLQAGERIERVADDTILMVENLISAD